MNEPLKTDPNKLQRYISCIRFKETVVLWNGVSQKVLTNILPGQFVEDPHGLFLFDKNRKGYSIFVPWTSIGCIEWTEPTNLESEIEKSLKKPAAK